MLFYRYVHVAVENRDTPSGYRLTFYLSFTVYAFFFFFFFFILNSDVHIPFFFTIIWLWTVQVRYTSSIYLPFINSCLVGVSTSPVTKPVVSRLLSEIQRSSYACSIGNEPQNTLFFYLMHCTTMQRVSLVTLCYPLYVLSGVVPIEISGFCTPWLWILNS